MAFGVCCQNSWAVFFRSGFMTLEGRYCLWLRILRTVVQQRHPESLQASSSRPTPSLRSLPISLWLLGCGHHRAPGSEGLGWWVELWRKKEASWFTSLIWQFYPLNKRNQCSNIGCYENKCFSESIGYWTVPRCLNPSNLALYHTFLSKFFLIAIAWNWNLIIQEGFLTLALYWRLGLGNSSCEELSCAQMFSSILAFYPAVSLQLPCSVLTTKKMSPDITKFPLKAKSPQLKTTAIKERQPSQFYSGEREVKVLVA